MVGVTDGGPPAIVLRVVDGVDTTDCGVPFGLGKRAIAVRVGGVTATKVGSGVGTTLVGDGPGGARTTAITGGVGVLSLWRSNAVTVYA